MVILVGISNWILSLLAYLGGKSLRIIVDIFGCGAFWPRALAQLEPPSVSNEDVQGSYPISPIVTVEYIYINGSGGFFHST